MFTNGGIVAVSGRVAFEIIDSREGLLVLKREWDELWRRSEGSYFQTFSCCLHSWDVMGGQRRRLRCLVGREAGVLVLVWPVVTQRRAFWSVARQLGPEAAEFTDVLVADEPGAAQRVAAAWRTLHDDLGVDLIQLPFVKVGSSLDQAVQGRGRVLAADPDIAPYAHLRGESDWESYSRTLSSSHRKKQRNLRRRLAEQGEVRFEVVKGDDSRCPSLINWMLVHKRQWSERVGKKGAWVFDDRYRDLLVRLVCDPDGVQQFMVFVLWLDDEPIAVKVAAMGRTHVDLVIAGYDATFGKYSPGTRLDEFWIPWILNRGLDCDFGAGGEHYKMYWSRNNVRATLNYSIAGTPWGVAGSMTQKSVQRARTAVRGWRN